MNDDNPSHDWQREPDGDAPAGHQTWRCRKCGRKYVRGESDAFSPGPPVGCKMREK